MNIIENEIIERNCIINDMDKDINTIEEILDYIQYRINQFVFYYRVSYSFRNSEDIILLANANEITLSDIIAYISDDYISNNYYYNIRSYWVLLDEHFCKSCAADIINTLIESGENSLPQETTDIVSIPLYCSICEELLYNPIDQFGIDYILSCIRKHFSDGYGSERILIRLINAYDISLENFLLFLDGYDE